MKKEHYAIACKTRAELNERIGSKKEEYSDWKRTTIANVAVVRSKKSFFSTNSACHAGLSAAYVDAERKGNGDILGTVSSVQRLKVKPEVASNFFRWLFNESPWKSVFATKDAEEALEHGIISEADVPNNLMVGGLVATRWPTEFPLRCDMWQALVNEGCEGDFAFCVSMLYKAEEGAAVNRAAGGHTPMASGRLKGDYLKRFLAHNPAKANKNYSEKLTYSGIDDTWGDGREGGKGLQTFLDKIKVGKGEVVDLNPFQVKLGRDEHHQELGPWCAEVAKQSVKYVEGLR